jgi:hypothetical protein
LLYDSNRDNFSFTEIGFYHSYSGSFRRLLLTEIIKNAFPSFSSVDEVKGRFLEVIKNFDYDEAYRNPVSKKRIRKPVKIGDTVTFCYSDSESDIYTVHIVDSISKLKNGIISQNEPLAQANLGISIGGNTNIDIKGLGIRVIKVLKIKPGKPVTKKKINKLITDIEINKTVNKNNEKISEYEVIDKFIGLMKVMPKIKKS